MKVITQMCQATWQPERVDCRNKAYGSFECVQIPTALREATMVIVSVSGRGSVLAHGRPKGGKRLSVKGGREGGGRKAVSEASLPLTLNRLPPSHHA
jgi:hypothetical protein